jgi:hypothetical protein
MTRAAVDDDSAGIGSVAASLPPSQDQAVEQPAPQPGPAGEQGVERAEWDVAQLADAAGRRTRRTRSPGSPCAAPLRSTAASARSGSTEYRLPPWPRVPPAPRRRRHRHRRTHPTRPETSWRG